MLYIIDFRFLIIIRMNSYTQINIVTYDVICLIVEVAPGTLRGKKEPSAFHGKARDQTITNTCYLFSLRDRFVILQRNNFVLGYVFKFSC